MGKVKRKDSLLKNIIKHKGLVLMALPGFIVMFMFAYVPMAALIVAFKEYNYSLGFWGSDWVGLKNFEFLIASRNTTIRILRNTVFYWVLFTMVGTILNVTIAILIYECTSKWFAKISHMVLIFPTFISWVAVSYIVKAYLGDGNGLFNQILIMMGKEPISWYLKPEYWPIILLCVNVWKDCGYGSVIYLSSLSGIDTALFEAAQIDGATKWQRIRYITIPMLKSMVSINILLALGGIMHSNTSLFYRVTRNTGLLYSTTQTIDAYVMNALTNNATNPGITGAVTFFQSVIGCVMVVLVNWLVSRKDEENALF